MNLYIQSAGILSAAGNNEEDDFLKKLVEYNTDRLLCKETNYTSYIPPMQLRRMSKAVRMGVGASKICLQHAGVKSPDAISVGTAFGCLHDTEIFLTKLIEQNEQMLTPTAFIQSTHNTVAGQIALITGCHGHNLTYVQRGHSFEHAMINAQLYLNEHSEKNILVGGIEELTETSIEVLKRANVYRQEVSSPQSILNKNLAGSIAGEGAAFFLVNSKPTRDHNLAVKDVATFVTRKGTVALENVHDFLLRQELNASDIDLVMLGVNGDGRSHFFYKELSEKIFKNNSQAAFKHICGEYPVASSFALGVLADAAKNGLASSLVLNHQPQKFKRLLMINNFVHHYSCWYIEVH